MKNQFYKLSMIIGLSCFFYSISVAQTPWNTNGNSNTGDTSFIGTKDYNDLIIKTDSVTRITISKDGDVNINDKIIIPSEGSEGSGVYINNNMNVSGTVTVDSLYGNSDDLRIKSNLNLPDKWIHADSLRCRVIHVGDSSINIGGTGPIGFNNNIFSTNGSLRIQSNAANNFSTIINAGTLARVCNSCLF